MAMKVGQSRHHGTDPVRERSVAMAAPHGWPGVEAQPRRQGQARPEDRRRVLCRDSQFPTRPPSELGIEGLDEESMWRGFA